MLDEDSLGDGNEGIRRWMENYDEESSELEDVDLEELVEDAEEVWEDSDNVLKGENVKATKRLALCNYDWMNINARDLMILFNSFKPKSGYIKNVKVFMSNLTKPVDANALSAVGRDARELRYGTRMIQAVVGMNCYGGAKLTNADRSAVLFTRNPMTGASIVIERKIEDLLRGAARDDLDPYILPGDALACYDSTVTDVTENTAPVLGGDVSVNAAENQTAVTTVTATDEDSTTVSRCRPNSPTSNRATTSQRSTTTTASATAAGADNCCGPTPRAAPSSPPTDLRGWFAWHCPDASRRDFASGATPLATGPTTRRYPDLRPAAARSAHARATPRAASLRAWRTDPPRMRAPFPSKPRCGPARFRQHPSFVPPPKASPKPIVPSWRRCQTRRVPRPQKQLLQQRSPKTSLQQAFPGHLGRNIKLHQIKQRRRKIGQPAIDQRRPIRRTNHGDRHKIGRMRRMRAAG